MFNNVYLLLHPSNWWPMCSQLTIQRLMQPPHEGNRSWANFSTTFLPPPGFLATALFGKASSKVGRRQRWWNLHHPFVSLPANMGFQNYFFKSQKKSAIKIVFVYSKENLHYPHSLFFTVKLSIWSFALKKKCIQINILQSPGILSMPCILRPSTLHEMFSDYSSPPHGLDPDSTTLRLFCWM